MPEAAWLDDPATLTYLHSTISTRRQRVRVPETPMHLDALLADQPLAGGLEPRLGDAHLRTLIGDRISRPRPLPASSTNSIGSPFPTAGRRARS